MIARAYLTSAWRLAAVRRSGHLAIVLVGRDQVLEVLRVAARGPDAETAIRVAVASVADEYSVRRVVVEPDSLVEQALAPTNLELTRLSIEDAAGKLLPEVPPVQRRLFAALVKRVPLLARHVVVFSATGDVASSSAERWRTVLLLAALLGLAAAPTTQLRNPTSHATPQATSPHALRSPAFSLV